MALPKEDENITLEAEAEPAPLPISDDPNKQLSSDEIAALFAAMG